MSLIVYLILLAVSGLIVGALGRLALPGRDPMTIPQTMLIGIAGSATAGIVAALLFRSNRGGGLLLSVVFAMLFVWLIRRSRQRAGSPVVGGTHRRFGL
ncbi:MAG: hypothetical protein JWP18_200 [Solirubrobacterales bacterium]|jgi:uncharacterized membrane protein YeaQ/YmgE (transglycosylase-associated protein family)|nr:hypothetical protein [Solirubrobacterales bacterium]